MADKKNNQIPSPTRKENAQDKKTALETALAELAGEDPRKNSALVEVALRQAVIRNRKAPVKAKFTLGLAGVLL